MKLTPPSAPFSKIDTQGEYVSIELSCTNLILPTGNSILLPLYNEYVLTEGRTLSDGTHTLTNDYDSATGIKNMMYPWIVVYSTSNNYVDFFVFTEQPTQLRYTVSSSIITHVFLYPGNGSISHGRIYYSDLTTDTNGDLIPDFLTLTTDGSIPKFLEPYSCVERLPELDQYILNDGTELTTSDGNYFFIPKSWSYVNADSSVIVDETKLLRHIPPGFAGLAIDSNDDSKFIDPALNSKIVNLFGNLGTSYIRFGRQEVDIVSWDPDGTPSYGLNSVFTQSYIDDIYTVLNQVGWNAIWSIDRINYNPSLYADEANYVSSVFGTKLKGIAIGNEPELDEYFEFRSAGFDYADYSTEWNAYYTAIKTLDTDIPIVSSDSYQSDWALDFIENDSTKVNYVTCHHYPLDNSVTDPTSSNYPSIQNLLSSETMDLTIETIQEIITEADVYGKRVILSETNSISNRGTAGVSDSMAGVLWILDYLFNMAKIGVMWCNFEGTLADYNYSPISSTAVANAPYYGMLAFHNAAPNGTLVSTDAYSKYNVTAHSVIGFDGKLRVVIINKDLTNEATLQIRTRYAYASASVIFCSAPSLDSDVITLGGNAVASDGSWSSEAGTSLTVVGNHTNVTIPVANAAIVTFSY